MQKLIKNKLFLGTLCLLLAGVLSFILLPKLYENELATTKIVVLNQTVEEGTLITESMLTSIEVGAYGLPDYVLKDESQVVGMVANATIYKGEYLQSVRFMSAEEAGAMQEEEDYNEQGFQLVTLELPSASAGIAGILGGGDWVDVYAYTEDELGQAVVNKVLSEIYIYKVFNSSLQSVDEITEENGNFSPSYIVVRVNEEQAKTLIALERADSMHLSLAKDGD